MTRRRNEHVQQREGSWLENVGLLLRLSETTYIMPNITVPFYMYTHPALDHSWLRSCEGFGTLRHSVNDSNTAEVGVHRLLRQHPARVLHAEKATLFYVPIFEYISYSLGVCNGTTHRKRMELARDALHASPAWQRNNGADHFWATSAWSISGSPTLALAARMQPLSAALSCGIAGRYKAFGLGTSVGASAGSVCTFEIPYQANIASEHLYRPRTDPSAPARTTLLHFAGALDVCCTGRQIRCAIAPLYGAVASGIGGEPHARGEPPSSASPLLSREHSRERHSSPCCHRHSARRHHSADHTSGSSEAQRQALYEQGAAARTRGRGGGGVGHLSLGHLGRLGRLGRLGFGRRRGHCRAAARRRRLALGSQQQRRRPHGA